MKHPPTRPTTQSSKNVWIGSAIAATTIAAIMALIQTKKDEAINPISSATVTAPASRVLAPHFSIKNGDMDDIIVARMDTLGQSHPTIVRLWSLIRQTPNIHIAFVSRETYIDGQV